MKLMPILGPRPLPVGERPHCLYCNAELKPNLQGLYTEVTWGVSNKTQAKVARWFTGTYGLASAFCSNQHAIYYALRVPAVKHRTGEFPVLREPAIPASWASALQAHVDQGKPSYDFHIPKNLLKKAR